ncbi:MAG: hypothetical protein RRA92_11290, partial [Gemmatimonadota bacterium]|nr:hypothetical protein [Gemmatimonadota bacterium]
MEARRWSRSVSLMGSLHAPYRRRALSRTALLAGLGVGAVPGVLRAQVGAWEALERARGALTAGQVEAGERAYWSGCGAGVGEAAEGYWRDAETLATPEERARVEGWRAGGVLADSVCGYLRGFWSQRAARAGLGVGERLAVHYGRLAHARAWYRRVTGKMGRVGVRGRMLSVKLDRPPGVELDDRGLVYVRLGEPNRRTSFAGQVEDIRVSPECYSSNESWAYDGPEGTRVYHFSPLDGEADWWLIEGLELVYRCGNVGRPDVQEMLEDRGGRLDLLSAGPRPSSVGGFAFLVLPELYLSRQGLDVRYAQIAHRILATKPRKAMPSPDPFDDDRPVVVQDSLYIPLVEQELFSERREVWKDAAYVLDSVPDRPEVNGELELRYELLQFRGREAGTGR